jgi:AhpD family alkylhydroperoxidase
MSEPTNSDAPPAKYEQFRKAFPEVALAYESLGEKCHATGPLDRKTRELVKLGFAIGAGLEGAAHAHTRTARAAGASSEEIRHVALLAITTLGFPASMRAMSWVNDVLGAL